MVTIDGKDLYLGRMASVLAKRLLKGETIDLVNCEKIRISGNKKSIYQRFKGRIDLHSIVNPRTYGPKYPKTPERLVKRSIRGMLPYDRTKGRLAFGRLKVHYGYPEDAKDVETIDGAKSDNITRFITVYDLCKNLGGIRE